MTSRIRIIGISILAMFLLTACGDRVAVPPAHVGKVLTKNGYKPENIPPSKFRLDACIWYCDALILAEMADIGMKENFQLFMPKDQLNMSFDIRFTMSMDDSDASIDSIFSRVPSESTKDTELSGWAQGIIPAMKVYRTYGQPVLREVIRTVVAKYAINEVASSRAAINAEVFEAVSEALDGTPISVKRLAFADIQFPAVIVEAKVKAAERRAAIQQAEANKQVILVNMQTELEKAKAERAVRREKALAAKEENNIFAESVTEKYLKYKSLEVLAAMADNPNSVFVPYQALDDIGLSQRIFAKGARLGD